MPALTLKNIPDDLYQKLKDAAQAHRRSLNNEIIFCLKTVLTPQKMSTSERLQRARNLRQQLPSGKVTLAEIKDAIEQGRP